MDNKKLFALLMPYQVFPEKSGGQFFIGNSCRALAQFARLKIISTNNNKTDEFEILPLLGNSRLRYVNPFLIPKLVLLFKKMKPDYLLIFHCYFGWLAIFIRLFTGIPFSVKNENIESVRFRSMGKWWWKIMHSYEKWILQQANELFFITPEDKNTAIELYELNEKKCHVATYGTWLNAAPNKDLIEKARQILESKHLIQSNQKILLFTGSLNYAPNLEALDFLAEYLPPILEKTNSILLVCGGGLKEKKDFYHHPKMIFAGFVDVIDDYYLGADIFLNPIFTGGGIKTKLVDALSFSCSSLSTLNGALGIPKEVSGNKLHLTKNDTKEDFIELINQFFAEENQFAIKESTPQSFYEYFAWSNIASSVNQILIRK